LLHPVAGIVDDLLPLLAVAIHHCVRQRAGIGKYDSMAGPIFDDAESSVRLIPLGIS
jgi:hypothetical protein